MVYECQACGYVHNPGEDDPTVIKDGIELSNKDIPSNWTCPVCGVGAEFLEEVSGRTAN